MTSSKPESTAERAALNVFHDLQLAFVRKKEGTPRNSSGREARDQLAAFGEGPAEADTPQASTAPPLPV